MARRRGFNEKTFFAYNPLPKLTDADVLKRAGLSDLMEASTRPPFEVTWTYGGTGEKETVHLAPGGTFLLRESETRDFIKEFDEQGFILIEDMDDEDEVKTKSLAGLQKAQKFWSSRGAKRLIELRKTHGYSPAEMEDFRYDHWFYYANQAKADYILDEMKRLRKPAKPVQTVGALHVEFAGKMVEASKAKPKRKAKRKRARASK